MPATTLVQARIDPLIKERATAVLERAGLTVSDAVRMLLTRTAHEGSLPFDPFDVGKHDQWFRAKVLEALADPQPDLDDAEVKALFAAKRAAARKTPQQD